MAATDIPTFDAKTIARFRAKFDDADASACWLWTAGLNHGGYGKFDYAGGQYATHFALLLDGHARPTGAMALHSCDTPACVNPAHLRWGTAQDNSDDMLTRGRNRQPSGDRHSSRTCPEKIARGERQWFAKMTADKVRAIRADPRPLKAVAAEYGVTMACISLIRLRKNWAHVS